MQRRILETGTTLRDDNWQLVEIYRDSPLYFFRWHCSSWVGKRRFYIPRCHAIIFYTRLTHPQTHTQVSALSKHNDRLTRLPRKAGFDLHAGEKRGKGHDKNMEDAERRKNIREEHTGRSSFT